MNIYKLYSTNNNYKTIAYDGTPLMSFLEDFNFDDYESIRKFNYHWENSDKPISDCPFLIGAIPVIRKSAIPKIRPAISSDLALLIDILVEGEPFVIILAKNILEDVLDESKSIINRFSDGRIMNIERYVFKKNRTYPPIFKISQLPTFTFMTDEFSEAISEANLTGIDMEKCEVKAKWLF